MLGHFIARLVRVARAFAPGVLVGWGVTCVLVAIDAHGWPGALAFAFCAATLGLIAWLALAFALIPLCALPEHALPSSEAQLDRSGAVLLLVQSVLALALFVPLRVLARPLVPAHLSYPDSIAFAVAAYGCAASAFALTLAYRTSKRAGIYPFWTAAVLFIAARIATRDAIHLIGQGYELWLDLLALAVLTVCCLQVGKHVQQRAKPVLAALAVLALTAVGSLVFVAGSRPAAFAAFAQSYVAEVQLLSRMSKFRDLDGDGIPGWLGGDCDDDDPLISPLAFEIVGNGIDDNCLGGELASVAEPAPRTLDARAPRRSMILVTVDAVRADMLDARHMPELTRFAAGAAVFERAYAVAPFTSGSLPTLMTGHYLMNTGALWLQDTGQEEPLAGLLGQAGYATCAVLHPFFKVEGSAWTGTKSFAEVRYVEPERYIDTRAVTGPAVTERALKELARLQAQPQPFFLWIHYLDAHAEYVKHPGTPFSSGDDARSRYAQEVWATDRELGRLIGALERSHFLDEGVLVVHSDHGEIIDDRGRTGHALWIDEDVLRSLLVLRAPGATAGRFTTRVRLIDLFPTLLGYAGASVPSSGASLVPIIAGQDTRDRDVFVYSFYADTRQSATLSGRYKLRQDYVQGTSFLYDLQADPRETTNLIERHPDVARKLRDQFGKTWDLELNDTIMRRRSLELLRTLCSQGNARACAAVRR